MSEHERIFDWLGVDSKGVSYHLHPLNLVWSDAGVEHDLQVYRRVADLLSTDKTYWAQIIREPNWRYSLAGCTCLMASRRCEFFDELCYRFREGSFVAPQVAVTLGLLHGAAARSFLERFLDDPAIKQRPKQAVSAHQVLARLGLEPAQKVSVESWTGFERDDAMTADSVVSAHWRFWSDRM